jgi:nitroimidazol reductase NimA-like FMN-containing flavoprotein (pyridoxamine 5'-phosphate oxidase superfamily)
MTARHRTAHDGAATMAPSPEFRELDHAECEALLRRHDVGRLAFSFHDRVAVEPLHYVYDAGWIYGRTSLGTKIEPLLHNRWVAFEVDEIHGTFDWRSVVAHGALYFVEPDGPPTDAVAYARAMELLRRVVPGTGTADDPVPHRTLVFRIHAEELTGRAASTGRRGGGRGAR